MSHPTHSSGSPNNSLLEIGNKFISPRENVKAVSIVENIARVTRDTGTLLKNLFKTTIDSGLGFLEMSLALPNNIIGAGTTVFDKIVVQSINGTRAAIADLIDHPFGQSGNAHAAAAHH